MRTLLVIGFFVTSSVAMLWTAAQGFEAAQKTRVSYKYFANALAFLPVANETVVWNAPESELVRPFTEVDATMIGQALHEAWQMLAVAQENDAPDLIADRFTGIAENRAALSVRDATSFGGRMVVLSQSVSPKFFHKDGSLFQARIEMVVARYLSKDGERLDAMRVTRDTGVATLLNEANGWRLMSWELRGSVPLEAAAAEFSGKLSGFNYYPAQTPWREFWPGFNEQAIAIDFDRAKALNANSLRIFLTRDDFLDDGADEALAKLATLLKLANEKGLKVVPTLFDLKQDYGLGTWAADALYLQRVLPALQKSPAVAFIDLKNEPDLDFDAHGKANVQAWLQSMFALTRDMTPGIPLTIGWSSAEAGELMIENLDVITYHEYLSDEGTSVRLDALRQMAGNKPIYVTEIGESTFSFAAGFPGSEATQAKRLSKRLQELQDADGVMVWTLYDFPKVDPSVVGGSPWVKRLQSSFGVLRSDGSAKPAAEVLRSAFSASE